MKRGKKYVEAAKNIDRTAQYDVAEAVSLVKKQQLQNLMRQSKLISEQAVMAVMQSKQIRGAVVLPHGTGKAVKVLVIAKVKKLMKQKQQALTSLVERN